MRFDQRLASLIGTLAVCVLALFMGSGVAQAAAGGFQLRVGAFSSNCLSLNQSDGFFSLNTRVWTGCGNGADKWTVSDLGGGPEAGTHVVQIVNQLSGLCVAPFGGPSLGARAVQEPCSASLTSTTVWIVSRVGDANGNGFYTFKNFVAFNNFRANECLDLFQNKGPNFELASCNGTDAQKYLAPLSQMPL
jgi:hypothetical protein